MHLEGSQLTCVGGCQLAEPLLELHCTVEGWSQTSQPVVSSIRIIYYKLFYDLTTFVNLLRLVTSKSLLLATLCPVLKLLLAAPVMKTLLASCLTHAAYSTPSLRLKKLMPKKL